MWPKHASKGEKWSRIQPPVLLNFSFHPSSAVLWPLLWFCWNVTSLLSLFILSEDKHIWKALFIQGNEILSCFKFKLFNVILSFYKYKFLQHFFSVWWLPATWSALTSHVCALAMLLPPFLFYGIYGLLTHELCELLFIFPLCDTMAELYKYKNVMWGIV